MQGFFFSQRATHHRNFAIVFGAHCSLFNLQYTAHSLYIRIALIFWMLFEHFKYFLRRQEFLMFSFSRYFGLSGLVHQFEPLQVCVCLFSKKIPHLNVEHFWWIMENIFVSSCFIKIQFFSLITWFSVCAQVNCCRFVSKISNEIRVCTSQCLFAFHQSRKIAFRI